MSHYTFSIRRAIAGDEEELTRLSLASKRHWNYPEHFYAFWQTELTFDSGYVERNCVYCAEYVGKLVGYYALVLVEKELVIQEEKLNPGYWLEHMFVLPEHIGRGLGRKLFDHFYTTCRAKHISAVSLLADPHARGFYEKMGCVYVKEFPSTIAGRTTPLLSIAVQLPGQTDGDS